VELSGKDSLRFWSKVRKTRGCWYWIGQKSSNGYGVFLLPVEKPRRKSIRAHRVSYMIHKGRLRKDWVPDHLCENKLCVNPAHLEAVPWGENCVRYFAKRKVCWNGHKLTDGSTATQYYVHKGKRRPFRRCRLCVRAAQRARYHRLKQAGKIYWDARSRRWKNSTLR
jgi:HNH endonuclease